MKFCTLLCILDSIFKDKKRMSMNSRNLTASIVVIVQLFSQKVVLPCPNLKADSLISGWKLIGSNPLTFYLFCS